MNRPGYHLTAPDGWLNDPVGVTWHDGRYTLFHQYVPGGPAWTPACRWGVAESPDLVGWRHLGVALAPAAGEDGCWSGAAVVDERGVPTILYTSVRRPDLGVGRVAVATGDPGWRRFTPEPVPVVTGPPPGVDAVQLRDPYVWRGPGGWRMVLGAGLRDGTAAALHYTSADLRDWRYAGVLAARHTDERQPTWTGSMWECPQLVAVGGAWALIVSVWHDDVLHGVAHALGTDDGTRFTAGAWRPLVHGDCAYATTTFPDRDGHLAAISWLRETDPQPEGRAWAGALSVPWRLARAGDRLRVTPHPDVDRLRVGAAERGGPGVLGPFPPGLDLTVAEPAVVAVEAAGGLLLTVTVGARAVTLARPAHPDVTVPHHGGPIRLLLDATIAEVFTGGEAAALRLAPATGPVLVRSTAAVTLYRMRE